MSVPPESVDVGLRLPVHLERIAAGERAWTCSPVRCIVAAAVWRVLRVKSVPRECASSLPVALPVLWVKRVWTAHACVGWGRLAAVNRLAAEMLASM